MILWTLFGLVLVAGLFPKTPIGRLFRTALFGDPDRPDATLRLPRIGKAFLVILILLAMGPTLPAELAVIFAGDLVFYLELSAAMMVAGVIGRVKGLVATIASVFSWTAARIAGAARRLVRRSARERKSSRRRAKPPRNDDAKPGWGCAPA